MNLELLDELIALGHGDKRSLDCLVLVKPKSLPSVQALQEGALKAQRVFSKTARHPVTIIENKSLGEFVDSSLPSPFHLELAIIDQDLVALKMSHLLGDAVSMILWLEALLLDKIAGNQFELKVYPPKKDTPYRKILNSKVWPRSVKDPGHRRRFLRFSLEHKSLTDVSLNDLMILALFDSFNFKRQAIWLPVNVRKNFFEGFGNGLSRLRVYPPNEGSIKERLAHIKKQKQEAKSSGEIALPPVDLDVSTPLKKNLFKAWVKRPWADWGSLSLSHLHDHDGAMDAFEGLWGISNIMPAHQAALFAFSKKERTDLTLTYDPNGVSDQEAYELIENFKHRTMEIFNDLLA